MGLKRDGYRTRFPQETSFQLTFAYRIFGDDNPLGIVKIPLDHQTVIEWGVLCFFKNEASHNLKAKGELYSAMMNNFFVPELDDVEVIFELLD